MISIRRAPMNGISSPISTNATINRTAKTVRSTANKTYPKPIKSHLAALAANRFSEPFELCEDVRLDSDIINLL